MCRLLIFGGTTEGRLLAEFCAEHRIPAFISVVSDYGSRLLPQASCLHIMKRPMDQEEMADFIREKKIELVVDATHPYALLATENIKKACRKENAVLLRCLRGEEEEGRRRPTDGKGQPADGKEQPVNEKEQPESDENSVVYVSDVEEAVRFLQGTEGNIFVTTGSKELSTFRKLPDFESRVFARVLPSIESVQQCSLLGISGKHLICMQGPFSEELNAAMMAQTDARWMVTKETGKNGGFEEKLAAAGRVGASAVVIRRRHEPDGMGVGEVKEEILRWYSGRRDDPGQKREERAERVEREEREERENRQPLRAALVGIGPGGLEQMTVNCVRTILESSVLLGAPRMLEAAKMVWERLGDKSSENSRKMTGRAEERERVKPRMEPLYLPEHVIRFLDDYEGGGTVTVLFSGDTGFYSGTKKLALALSERNIPFETEPGVSSAAYLASRLGISWENALFLTAHGRTLDLENALSRLEQDRSSGGKQAEGRWMFILLSGSETAGKLCRQLSEAGYSRCRAAVGERLSYPEERIRRGTVGEFTLISTDSLAVLAVKTAGG